MTTNNIHKRQTSVPPAGFEPAIPASETRGHRDGLIIAQLVNRRFGNNILSESIYQQTVPLVEGKSVITLLVILFRMDSCLAA